MGGSGSGGENASINAATKKGLIQKVMARTTVVASPGNKSTLLLSPVKPGQIIKFEGQSIVGKSNNNAIVGGGSGQQTEASKSAMTASGGADEDDSSFKITPDYIQESEFELVVLSSFNF